LLLPSLLFKTAGRDAWIAAAIGTAIELLILYFTILYVSKKPKTLFYNDTKFFSKFFMLIFLAVFVYEILILLSQAYELLNDNLFEHVNRYTFFIPLILMGLFFCFCPSRAIFRSGEVFFVFIILGVAISVFPALTRTQPSEILPIFENGFMPILNAVLQNIIYFQSALFILIFKGEITTSPRFKTKFMTASILVGLFFVFFVFMFVCLFGELAEYKTVAITNFVAGRSGWTLVTMWLLLLLLRFGVTFFCAWRCMKYIAIGEKAVKND
jgi:spore germination protein KB